MAAARPNDKRDRSRAEDEVFKIIIGVADPAELLQTDEPSRTVKKPDAQQSKCAQHEALRGQAHAR